MPDTKKYTEVLKKIIPEAKRPVLIAALGVIGIIFIFLSQFTKTEENVQINNTYTAQADTKAEEYIYGMESRLNSLITSIEGVGRAQVMVTLENTGEYIYAQEEKRSADKITEENENGIAAKSTTKESAENKYILLNGQKEALVKAQLEPQIKGVVVICEGADSAFVRQRIVNVVTTVLNISTARVCVEKIRPDE